MSDTEHSHELSHLPVTRRDIWPVAFQNPVLHRIGKYQRQGIAFPLEGKLCGRVNVMGTVGSRKYSSNMSFEQFLKDLFD